MLLDIAIGLYAITTAIILMIFADTRMSEAQVYPNAFSLKDYFISLLVIIFWPLILICILLIELITRMGGLPRDNWDEEAEEMWNEDSEQD